MLSGEMDEHGGGILKMISGEMDEYVGILKMISGEMDENGGGDMENVFKWTIDKNSIKR